jgi:hypothetical protein
VLRIGNHVFNAPALLPNAIPAIGTPITLTTRRPFSDHWRALGQQTALIQLELVLLNLNRASETRPPQEDARGAYLFSACTAYDGSHQRVSCMRTASPSYHAPERDERCSQSACSCHEG